VSAAAEIAKDGYAEGVIGLRRRCNAIAARCHIQVDARAFVPVHCVLLSSVRMVAPGSGRRNGQEGSGGLRMRLGLSLSRTIRPRRSN
jgi:hypothetical protein